MLFFFVLAIIIWLSLVALSYILSVGDTSSGVHGTSGFSQQSVISSTNDGILIDGKKRLSANNSFVYSTIISPTGGGKTTRFALPNILALDNCSMVISDTKGELYDLTQHALRKKGYEVLCLDFNNISASVRYNPLLRLDSDAKIKQFALALFDMSNAGTKVEGIWRLDATRMLEILLTALKGQADQKLTTLSSLIHLLNHCESSKRVSINIIIQSLTQLDAVYGNNGS